MKMDICVPKALPIVRAENLSWMAGVTFKPSSFRCGRELRHRKRPRDGDECNLFSRIRKWVGDDLVCSTSSSQLSPSCQVQLSPKDSGVDLNSPPHRDDGMLSSSIMPDSRSEECERTTVPLPKRRRSSSSDNLLKKERIDLVKMTRDFSKESKPPSVKSSKHVERTLETVSETVMKKYTLVSNNTKAGPLVIKLRACPVESTQTTTVDDELEDNERQLHSVESPGMISSTVHNQLTPVGSHDPVSSKKTLSRNRSNLSSVHQSKSLSTVVSSTTKHRKELKKKTKKKKLPNPIDCVTMTAGDSKDKSNAAAIELGACLNVKHSKKAHFADNSFAGKATAFSNCDHEEAHTRAISPSARKVEVNSKTYARTRSNRESCVDEVSTCANSIEVNIVNQDYSSLPVVSSSCAVAERKEFISEKLPLVESPNLTSNVDNPSKDMKTNGFLSEFAKFIKSSDQSAAPASVPPLRHGPGSYQVTRRHARIFRRSTLVPQLHRSLLLRKESNRVQDLHRSVSVKQEPVHQVDLIESNVALPQSCNALMEKNDDISVDTLGQLESKIIGGDVLSSISSPDLLFDDEDDSEDNLDLLSTLSTGVLYDAQTKSEIAPDLLSATSLCEARVGCEIIPDDLLFDLPITSSLQCDTKDARELSVLEEALCHLPSTGSLSCESSFISDQMQLTKLRHSVFWLLKTLVPQLQLPNRFDMSGPAVDEMVDVVCEELDSRSRQQSTSTTTRSEVVSSELEYDGCLNSLVGLCRSPHDCLARLRCKVLAMLSMLLGLDLDESNDEDLLESLLDAVVCANREDDDEVLPNDSIHSSPPSMGTPELFRMDEFDNERTFMPWEGEAPEEASSVDSFSDIPELLVEPERKFVTSDLEDFLEPPKLTAVDER